MIGEFIYMLPSDMNLRIGRVQGYNNKILVSRTGFKIGTNLKINLDAKSKEVEMVKTEPDVKPKVKTKPNIKSNKEHKQDVKINLNGKNDKSDIESNREHKRDVKMIETKPDMNKITYEEEKGCFGIGNNIYLYSMVDVQMTYLLLVFVMKYVYIKTPTPVIRAHKF